MEKFRFVRPGNSSVTIIDAFRNSGNVTRIMIVAMDRMKNWKCAPIRRVLLTRYDRPSGTCKTFCRNRTSSGGGKARFLRVFSLQVIYCSCLTAFTFTLVEVNFDKL